NATRTCCDAGGRLWHSRDRQPRRRMVRLLRCCGSVCASLLSVLLSHLDLRGADHRSPFFDIEVDLLGEFFARAGDRLIAERGKTLLDFRQRDDAHNMMIE